ncbi:MAG: hypothetical protein AAGE37_06900 [Pseudomonadota bacterium]
MNVERRQMKLVLKSLFYGNSLSDLVGRQYTMSQLSVILFRLEEEGLIAYKEDDAPELTSTGLKMAVSGTHESSHNWIEKLSREQIKTLDEKSVYLPSPAVSKMLNE